MSILILPPTEEQLQMASLRAEVELLRREVEELANRIAAWPTPARDGWERHSSPFIEEEIEETRIPDTEENEFDPQLLKMPVGISRVEIDEENRITTFDQDGLKIAELCGPFSVVGMAVLARSGGLEWQLVAGPTRKLSLVS